VDTKNPITNSRREALNKYLARFFSGARSIMATQDPEIIDAINRLAAKQGISLVAALKKAVITGTFLYDLTSENKGRLLIENPDKSVSQITLK
jgi:hypothetical protein